MVDQSSTLETFLDVWVVWLEYKSLQKCFPSPGQPNERVILSDDFCPWYWVIELVEKLGQL
ncbi:hypothetical protein [Nostoc sp.]|uniref:hypothetical protein n=1 Tax=Nostoc sp. TaxID=1180 RepID=UPI002FF22751